MVSMRKKNRNIYSKNDFFVDYQPSGAASQLAKAGYFSSAMRIEAFKHPRLKLQLELQLDPNSIPNLTQVGVKVGV